MQICVTPAPAGPASSGWSSVTLVKGQQADPAHGVPWQGWYSQVYDDAWPAPTLLYDALQVRAKGRSRVSVSRGAVQLRPRSTRAGACLPTQAICPLSLWQVPAQSVFAWLLVPTAQRGPCAGTIEVVSAGAASVVVRVDVGGGAQEVTVPIAGAASAL